MIRRCLRTVTRLGLRLGVATGIGFGIYRLIGSRRNQSRTDSDTDRHGDSAALPARPDTMPRPTARTGAEVSTSPPRPISIEPVTPDPPLVEPEMLTSVKGLSNREPIAGVGFGSGIETNGSSTAGAAPVPVSPVEPPAPTLPDSPPATKKTPATKKAGPAKKPSAAAGKLPSKSRGTAADTSPKMPPDRKPGKSRD